MVTGRRAGNELTRRHTTNNQRPSGNYSIVANLQVPGNSRLPRHGDTVADGRAACDSNHGHDETVLSHNYVVTQLHQIIDLCSPTNDGSTTGGSVNGNIGSNFHIVFNNHRTDMFYLLVPVCGGDKTKPVGAEHDSRVNNTVFPHLDAILDHRVGVDDRVIPYTHIRPDVDAGIDDRVIPDPAARFDKSIGLYGYIVSQNDIFADDGGLVYAHRNLFGRRKRSQQLSPGQAGMQHSNERFADFRKILRHHQRHGF